MHKVLLLGAGKIGDKVREEADEAARAAASESDARLIAEAADLIYHLHVLLISRGVSVAAISTFRASWAVPALPGATKTRGERGL